VQEEQEAGRAGGARGGGEETAGGEIRKRGRRKTVGPCPDMWGPLPHHQKPPSKPMRY
jgi:hypothetical protein